MRPSKTLSTGTKPWQVRLMLVEILWLEHFFEAPRLWHSHTSFKCWNVKCTFRRVGYIGCIEDLYVGFCDLPKDKAVEGVKFVRVVFHVNVDI